MYPFREIIRACRQLPVLATLLVCSWTPKIVLAQTTTIHDGVIIITPPPPPPCTDGGSIYCIPGGSVGGGGNNCPPGTIICIEFYRAPAAINLMQGAEIRSSYARVHEVLATTRSQAVRHVQRVEPAPAHNVHVLSPLVPDLQTLDLIMERTARSGRMTADDYRRARGAADRLTANAVRAVKAASSGNADRDESREALVVLSSLVPSLEQFVKMLHDIGERAAAER